MQYSFVFLVFFLAASCSAFVRVDPVTKQFIDGDKRVRIFHGVNVVYKIPPYVPDLGEFNPFTSFGEQDYLNMKKWGWNAVRLGVMWPGWELQEGVFNKTYLSMMRELVDYMGEKYGIYTIVDLHQDLLSRYYCGEGAPDYFTECEPAGTEGFPKPIGKKMSKDSDGFPVLEECLKRNFAMYYPSLAVGYAFHNLYTNKCGQTDKFLAYWAAVSQAFASSKYVIAYDLINEPWIGSYTRDPSVLLPGHSDKKYLQPLYKAAHNTIRKNDDNHIIMFEHTTFDMPFPVPGFTDTPGGESYNDRQVFSYHLYCLANASGVPRNLVLCDKTHDYFWHNAMNFLKKFKIAGFMTEFGASLDTKNSNSMLTYLADLADGDLQSWTYWQYKYFLDLTTAGGEGESLYFKDGSLQEGKVKALSRTYPTAIAGVPNKLTFNETNSHMHFEYSTSADLGSETVIYLNEEMRYKNGFKVQIVPASGVSWSRKEPNYLSLKHNAASLKVTVDIVPV